MEGLLKIDSILFYVTNINQSTRFYQNVLGMEKAWTDPEQKMIGFIFPQSDSEIVIHNINTLPNPSFSFLVKNVLEFCIDFKRQGYKILEEPFEVRTGKFAILEDLDGNKIPIIDLTNFGNQPRYNEN